MTVKSIFVNTYRYDFHLAKVCIASIRYWYPEIPVLIIKDYGKGNFNTKRLEDNWDVSVFNTPRRKFDWGYGKLEPLFLNSSDSFLVLDADTVLIGPVLDKVKEIDANFIVDDEVQPAERFNEIYYHLDKINQIAKDFVYPGYSFNSGQWFGTSGILTRSDFEKSLTWDEPPKPKFPEIVFNGDQAHLNFVLHLKEQQRQVSIKRMKLMIWPHSGNADFIDISELKNRKGTYPYIIHWAGMNNDLLSKEQRKDIFDFFRHYYYSIEGQSQALIDRLRNRYLSIEKKLRARRRW